MHAARARVAANLHEVRAVIGRGAEQRPDAGHDLNILVEYGSALREASNRFPVRGDAKRTIGDVIQAGVRRAVVGKRQTGNANAPFGQHDLPAKRSASERRIAGRRGLWCNGSHIVSASVDFGLCRQLDNALTLGGRRWIRETGIAEDELRRVNLGELNVSRQQHKRRRRFLHDWTVFGLLAIDRGEYAVFEIQAEPVQLVLIGRVVP